MAPTRSLEVLPSTEKDVRRASTPDSQGAAPVDQRFFRAADISAQDVSRARGCRVPAGECAGPRAGARSARPACCWDLPRMPVLLLLVDTAATSGAIAVGPPTPIGWQSLAHGHARSEGELPAPQPREAPVDFEDPASMKAENVGLMFRRMPHYSWLSRGGPQGREGPATRVSPPVPYTVSCLHTIRKKRQARHQFSERYYYHL